MNEMSSTIMHYSNIIVGERFAIGFLLIVLLSMALYREKRKSTYFLALTTAIQVVVLLADSMAFSYAIDGGLSLAQASIVYFISYVFVLVVLIPYCLYAKYYIEERTTINKWVFLVPIVLSVAAIVILVGSIISGTLYAPVDGMLTSTGDYPALVSLIKLVVVVYIPVVAFIKRKAIGLRAVFMLGIFGIFPVAVMFISFDYSTMLSAYSITIIYVLLQSNTSLEREEQRKKLEILNHQLTEANDEKLAQIEEISALNTQLEENQARLEEKQAQLEESTSEQEVQIEEINNLKRAADAANKAKTDFLFNMSHDIRTPMNAIIGFANLMESNFDDRERCRSYLGKIQSSSELLLSLINNILEMARIESGKVLVDEIPCSVLDISNNVCTVFDELMREKHIDYTLTNHFTTSYIYIDKVKANEIFVNIISNAYKYTQEGGSVTVDVREMPSDLEGYINVQVTVSDTGVGMAEDYIPHIFEEFSREHTSTENKIEGTGLGLPIVKKLVDLLNGTITVESKLGEGTTFVVTLPHRIADEEEIRAKYTEETNPDYLTGKRVLLAEDNDLNAEIAMEILKEAGLVVERAEDGIICVDMLSKSEKGYYDLILMDIQMPNMDGYRATHLIRGMEDYYRRNIPVIAMTANAFEEDRKNAIKAGMDGHVAKPIDVNVLFDTITEVLRKKAEDMISGPAERF